MRTIKLMADYGCYPLWEASPGCIGNINPDDLPLSEELKRELLAWARQYDGILNWSDPASSGFADKAEEEAFRQKGIELGKGLRTELDPDQYSVIVHIVI